MATITTLKSDYNSVIRIKTADNSITTDNVADLYDGIADELLERGVLQIANTAALATADSANSKMFYVTNVGFFFDSATGPANGTTIFAGVGGRFWHLVVAGLSIEEVEDAIGAILVNTNTITFTYNDATPSITADVITQMSITSTSGGLKLVNDATSPGNSVFYSTTSGGIKGWRSIVYGDLPSLSAYFIENQSSVEQAGNFWAKTGKLTAQQVYGATFPVAALSIIGGGVLPVPTVGLFIAAANNATEPLLQIDSYLNENVISIYEEYINIGHQGTLPTGGTINIRLTDASKGLLIRAADNTNLNLFEGQDNGGGIKFSVGASGEAYLGSSQTIIRRLSTITTTADNLDYYIAMDATLGNITINLPTAVGITGRLYVVKKIDSTGNIVTVDPAGSETIDGLITVSLITQYDWVLICSNGANWEIIG